jgi:zinc protease
MHMRKLPRSLFVLLVLCLSLVANGQRVEFTQETLDNGLRVIYAPLRQAPVVHVRVLYHVGSRDERPDRQGFAHLFEHMMFRGSAHVQPEQHMKLVGMVGGYSNAFTSFDQTVYVNTLPSNQLGLGLYLEADRMASFKVSDEIYRTERKVVAEEWGRRQNQPYGTLHEDFFRLAYRVHSYRWTPIGDMDHLRAAGPAELQEFFNRYYVPNNAVLVIAGDIEIPAAQAMVKRYFAWIPRGQPVLRQIPPEPARTELARLEVTRPVPLPAMLLGFELPNYRSPQKPALELLASILGSGSSSRLDELLVTGAQPLCSDVSASAMILEDAGMLFIQAMPLLGKDPGQVEQLVWQAVNELREKGVTEDELAKARTRKRVAIAHARQTAERLASSLGQEALFGGDAGRVNEEMARIEAVTVRDVAEAVRGHLSPQNAVLLWFKPAEKPSTRPAMAAPASAAASQVAAVTTAAAPRAVQFPADYPQEPPVDATTIAPRFARGQQSALGAATLLVFEDARLPLVHFSLVMRRGGDVLPAGKEGLASLTAALVQRGAGDLSYQQLSRDLDPRGITLEVTDGGDVTRLNGSCLSDQLEHALLQANRILTVPRLEPAEFARLQKQMLTDIRQSLESPETIAANEIASGLYGTGPQGRWATPQSIAALTLDDVKKYWQDVYVARDSIITLAGDVKSVAGAQELAATLVKGLPDRPLAAPAYVPTTGPTTRRIVVIDRPQGRQSLIRMGIRAYDLHSPDKFAGTVADRILSHGIDSRLGRVVRAQKGYAYSVWGMFRAGRHGGEFVSGTETGFATTADAIEAIFKVFGDMRSAEVTDSELAQTKLRVSGAMVMGMQTIQQQVNYRVDGLLNGYPEDYFDRYPQRIGAVTAADVRRVCEKYLDDPRMLVVVVAPAAAVQERLSRLGQVQVLPMPLQRTKVGGDDARP